LTQEVPALGKLHVLAVPCEAPRFIQDLVNARPPTVNMWIRDAPWGQCLSHDIDPRNPTPMRWQTHLIHEGII
jgi:hypothetical protein